MRRIGHVFAWMMVVLLTSSSAVHAIGVLYAGVGGTGRMDPLPIRYVHAKVEMVDQVAVTTVDQVFQNPSDRVLEGVYVFPLPENATVTEFALWIDGQRVIGEITEKEEARRTYEDIVRRQIDPALLEYLGENVFKIRVFPIPVRGERRLEMTYAELLPYDFGTVEYRLPLQAEAFSPVPLESVIADVHLLSQRPIVSIQSPSHPDVTDITIKSAEEATIFYGDEGILPDRDLRLKIQLSSESIGFNLLTYVPPDSTQEEGYYLFWVTPPDSLSAEQILFKDMVFVIDVSSSMEGTRIRQAKEAADRMIELLGPGDRFNIIAFGTRADLFKSDLVVASEESKTQARQFVRGLRALGLTNIEEALRKALSQSFSDSAAALIAFLTDGVPTYGETEPERIIQKVGEQNSQEIRIFTFGVGEDIDRPFLIELARENHGRPLFIEEDENLAPLVQDFFTRVSRPVLSHLSIDFGDLQTYDTYPVALPDLFVGTQLRQTGRYTGGGTFTLALKGDMGGVPFELPYPTTFSQEEGGYPFIARIWAGDKVAYLLEQIALYGEQAELVDAVRELGLRYQIVTPYTSFLVTEPEDRSPTDVEEEQQALVWKGKTFLYEGGWWIDSALEPDMPVVEVSLLSRTYFDLLQEKPALEQYFQLGRNMIVAYEGVAYKLSVSVPMRPTLGQNWPNPFNARTVIPFFIPSHESGRPVDLTIHIYDLMGQVVRTLFQGNRIPGSYLLEWDGLNDQGQRVASGMYLYVLEVRGYRTVRRMVVVM